MGLILPSLRKLLAGTALQYLAVCALNPATGLNSGQPPLHRSTFVAGGCMPAGPPLQITSQRDKDFVRRSLAIWQTAKAVTKRHRHAHSPTGLKPTGPTHIYFKPLMRALRRLSVESTSYALEGPIRSESVVARLVLAKPFQGNLPARISN